MRLKPNCIRREIRQQINKDYNNKTHPGPKENRATFAQGWAITDAVHPPAATIIGRYSMNRWRRIRAVGSSIVSPWPRTSTGQARGTWGRENEMCWFTCVISDYGSRRNTDRINLMIDYTKTWFTKKLFSFTQLRTSVIGGYAGISGKKFVVRQLIVFPAVVAAVFWIWGRIEHNFHAIVCFLFSRTAGGSTGAAASLSNKQLSTNTQIWNLPLGSTYPLLSK